MSELRIITDIDQSVTPGNISSIRFIRSRAVFARFSLKRHVRRKEQIKMVASPAFTFKGRERGSCDLIEYLEPDVIRRCIVEGFQPAARTI
jgi:hypothetical protein